MEIDLASHRRKVNALLTELDHAGRQVREEKARLASARDREAVAREAQRVLQEVAKAVQQQAHDRIASVVTRCLEAVFGPEAYEFRVVFETKRGRTEARLVFVRDGEEYDPTTCAGGGVVDVASFALRMACLMLTRPRVRRLIVLDEPLKHLSDNYHDAAREMIETLSREMKIQVIMVTHSEGLICGKEVRLCPQQANEK